jgi:hypothetical protein
MKGRLGSPFFFSFQFFAKARAHLLSVLIPLFLFLAILLSATTMVD